MFYMFGILDMHKSLFALQIIMKTTTLPQMLSEISLLFINAHSNVFLGFKETRIWWGLWHVESWSTPLYHACRVKYFSEIICNNDDYVVP